MSYKSQPTFGRHGAHKHHDTMGEVSITIIVLNFGHTFK